MHKYGKICVTMSVVITMYFILFCIIMELCTYFWCRIITPLGVCTNLFFVFIKITSLSSRWLELIWFHLYHSANGVDSLSSPVPRSKELNFNNWLIQKIICCLQDFLKYTCFNTVEYYKNSFTLVLQLLIKLIFMIFQRYWLRAWETERPNWVLDLPLTITVLLVIIITILASKGHFFEK